MKSNLKIFTQAYILVFLVISFLVNGATWFLANHLNSIVKHELVILHYTVDLGVDLVGPSSKLFSFPMLGLGMIFVSCLVVWFFNNRFNNYLILLTSLVANLAIFLSLITVYLINFR